MGASGGVSASGAALHTLGHAAEDLAGLLADRKLDLRRALNHPAIGDAPGFEVLVSDHGINPVAERGFGPYLRRICPDELGILSPAGVVAPEPPTPVIVVLVLAVVGMNACLRFRVR
jgi:hypothetical protein